jgi:predicted alpha/beta-hydrolase family hydrolase
MARGIFIDAVFEGLTTLGWLVVRFDFPKGPGKPKLVGKQMGPDKLPVLIETYRSIVEAMHRCDQHPFPPLIGGQSIAVRIETLVSGRSYIEG